MFAKLPIFYGDQTIRQSFLTRVAPDMTPEAKATLNLEFNQAILQAKQDIEVQRQAISKQNPQTFLANPKQAVEWLEANCPKGYTIGEILPWWGIGTVKSTRFGKGHLIGKGSDCPAIRSNFKVNARIGDKGLIEELSSTNDRHSKDRLEAGVLEDLARQLASGNFGTPQDPSDT